MSNHLKFEEIVDFIYATAVTDEYIKLAAKVNSHIYKCGECREIFNELTELKEAMEEERLMPLKRDSVQLKLMRALAEKTDVFNRSVYSKKRLCELINQKTYNEDIKIKCGKLESDDRDGKGCFSYDRGTLEVSLPNAFLSDEDVVFAVSQDYETSKISFPQKMKDGSWKTEICELPDGEYSVFVGKDCKGLFSDQQSIDRLYNDAHFLKFLQKKFSEMNIVLPAAEMEENGSVAYDGINRELLEDLEAEYRRLYSKDGEEKKR